MAVIGIDLGTTYSAAAEYVDGETDIIYLGERPTLPSVVGVGKRGKIEIGYQAKRNQAANPQDTVVEIKRKMGKDVIVSLGQNDYSPPEISAMILSKIKELAEKELDEEITGAVISCPAYFRDPERNATKEAGQLAGLNVLQIVNEPTAAAFAYANAVADLEQGHDSERLAMVYDLGGGTFDVTIIKMLGGNVEVIGTGGDPELGGGNFDDCIVDWMLEELEKIAPTYLQSLNENQLVTLKIKLKFYAEEAKKILCGPPEREAYQFQIAQLDAFGSTPISFSSTLTMAEFESRIETMMQESLRWLDVAMENPKKEFNYTEANLTDILLVGGSTRVPYVRRLLEKRYPNVPLRDHLTANVDPDEIVARGAAIIAAQADPDSGEFIPNILTEVTGHTLSVEVFDPQRNQPYLHPLILKDTVIPVDAQHEFASMGRGQTRVQVKVYQGEGREITPEVTMIGEFIIEIEPRQEQIPLEIGLRIDSNGLLLAHATDKLAQRQVKCEINYEDSVHLSPDELEQRQKKLAADMAARVGRTANPLDEPQQSDASAGGWANPQRPSQAADTTPEPQTTGDPLAALNPLVASLRDKATANFSQVPAQNQMRVMQIVSDLGTAAQVGDGGKVMELGMELNQLLQGIG